MSALDCAPSSPKVVPRNAIRRNNSTPTVQTITSVIDMAADTSTAVTSRVSMDSYDRPRGLRASPADASILSSSAPARSSFTKSGHKKSSSSPSNLLSPPLAPASTASSVSTPDASLLGTVPASEELPRPLKEPGVVASLFSFGRASGSVSSTPAATPPPSPALLAASTKPSRCPSPSTTPPSSPSPSFFARLPSIPRPSPMMPFRAARKVVTSVTSVGTGLLPSKEQLGSIPVAGRILKHPVMDSTLTYIASKTTHRGGKGPESKPVSPEDVHYRKLNRRLVDQSITLAALAVEKEELSKTIDDEAGDDAFELYLAAIATLMHALPIETCDPLRREALELQLRNFLHDNELESLDNEVDSKERRRLRRRRHRQHRDQASSLIHEHSLAPHERNSTNHQSQDPAKSSRARRKDHRSRRQRKSDGSADPGPTLGDTIISTAVESAIRLKQSPIPDVIRTCFKASRIVLSRVDERFRLQERAWELSKQSIEKAIELDEQYAIHELVTDTLFATVTGLVKAGIAYKETPGYGSGKSLAIEQPLVKDASAPAHETERLRSPQTVINKKALFSTVPGRRYSVIEEENEDADRGQSEEAEASDSNLYDSEDSESSCFTTSDSSEEDDDMQDTDGHRSTARTRRPSLLSTAAASLPGPYKEQVQQKIGLFMALKGAASLILGAPSK
ncbi:hypothetical protein BGZ70_000605 [Mortierella alpina]|uniref:Uncharacterized protein n=1 Tax=Mortierella alpina TaxID=64518 RepID=A0A9P6LYS9_MORAP|nr:hypothetical protein BGZ70_000605 [Mortierella alpina]